MRAPIFVVVATLTVALASPALAQEDEGTPPPEADSLGETYVGMRAAYAVPLGNLRSSIAEGDVPLADNVSAAVPIWLDAEYAPLPEIVLGLSLIWGPAMPVSVGPRDPDANVANIRGCPEGSTCKSYLLRPGGHVLLHPFPEARVDPWIGAGVGYEWLLFNMTTGSTKNKVHYHGPELINAQLGVDFRLTDSTWIGLFGAFQVVRSIECGLRTNQRTQSCNIVDRTQHEWASAGLRVRTHFWKIRRASAISASL